MTTPNIATHNADETGKCENNAFSTDTATMGYKVAIKSSSRTWTRSTIFSPLSGHIE